MHEGKRLYVLVGVVVWLAVSLFFTPLANAIYLDDERTIFLSGVFYNQLRLRTEKPRGRNTKVGDWTPLQHRYFVDPQLNVDTLPWIRNLPWGATLAEDLQIDEGRFFFNPRFEYDGVYDYGPDAFRDDLPPRLQKGNRLQLFEVYGTIGFFGGRFNLKVGRQNLSWGNTSIFRLIDRINPLDNGFGGTLIPLDERRRPLNMVRATLRLPDVPEWDIYNTTLEGFIAPDKRLPQGAPGPTPWGVIGPPAPTPTLQASLREIGRPLSGTQLDRPDISLGDSRMGVRLLWTWRDATFTLAHMSTYPDAATQALRLNSQGDPVIKLLFPNMQVTGATVEFPIGYTLLRTEIAGFFDEPFFIENVNFRLGVPVPKRNVIRGVFGFDHNQRIAVLNPFQTFLFSGQFFVSGIQGSMKGIAADRHSFTNTLAVSTNYGGVSFLPFEPQISPQMVFVYDWEGAWQVQPGVTFIRDPWRFTIEYSTVWGRFTGVGRNKDKDNIAFRIDYLL